MRALSWLELREFLRSRRGARISVWVSLSFIFLMTVWLLYHFFPLGVVDPFVPLHYNVLLGIDRYGPWWQGLFLPAFGVVVIITNSILAARFASTSLSAFGKHRSEPLLTSVLLWSMPLVTGLLMLGVFFLLLINT